MEATAPAARPAATGSATARPPRARAGTAVATGTIVRAALTGGVGPATAGGGEPENPVASATAAAPSAAASATTVPSRRRRAGDAVRANDLHAAAPRAARPPRRPRERPPRPIRGAPRAARARRRDRPRPAAPTGTRAGRRGMPARCRRAARMRVGAAQIARSHATGAQRDGTVPQRARGVTARAAPRMSSSCRASISPASASWSWPSRCRRPWTTSVRTSARSLDARLAGLPLGLREADHDVAELALEAGRQLVDAVHRKGEHVRDLVERRDARR